MNYLRIILIMVSCFSWPVTLMMLFILLLWEAFWMIWRIFISFFGGGGGGGDDDGGGGGHTGQTPSETPASTPEPNPQTKCPTNGCPDYLDDNGQCEMCNSLLRKDATSSLATNHKFNVPDLKVGTLDQLVGLSDDLSKIDSAAEQTTRKLVQYFSEVLEEERDKLNENLVVGNKDMHSYVTKFQWEGAKYPLKQSLKVLSEIIGKQITQIDNDLKTKAQAFNNLKNSLASIDRKSTGSLITKDLGDIVKGEDFVLGSEYLQTVVVVIPKVSIKEWEAKYASYADMVVPGSAKRITEDNEHALYTVTLFQKVFDEYKANCRENKFIVRDFVYDEQSLKAGKNERDKLLQEKAKQYAPLVRWLRINFGEIFSAYVHVKALRVFVESVLRFGLPVNFQAIIMEPSKNAQKRVRSELQKLYQHLDGTAAGPIDTFDDAPALASLGVHDYFPYVFFKMNIVFVDRR